MNNKNQLIEFINKAITRARTSNIDRLVIEDENESDGLYLSITFYKNNFGEGDGIEEYRDAFYEFWRMAEDSGNNFVTSIGTGRHPNFERL
jgi:hypothetical protein